MPETMHSFLRSSLLLLAFGSALAACTSAADLAARDNERCVARGLTPKTDNFANCLLQLEGERSARMEQRRRYELEKPFDPSTLTGGR